MKKLLISSLFLAAILSFAVSIAFYKHLPEEIATHWDMKSQPSGFMSKKTGAFLIPVIILMIICINLSLIKFLNLPEKNPLKKFLPVSAILISGFMLYTHLTILLFNVGVEINVLKHTLIGLVLLITSMQIPILLLFRKKSYAFENGQPDNVSDQLSSIYSDHLVDISDSYIIFKCYYFPAGRKKLYFHEIDFVKSVKGGCWRMHGTGNFRTWFPADYNRPARDRTFIVHLRNKWKRIGFTVENSMKVSEILKRKGLLRLAD